MSSSITCCKSLYCTFLAVWKEERKCLTASIILSFGSGAQPRLGKERGGEGRGRERGGEGKGGEGTAFAELTLVSRHSRDHSVGVGKEV